MSTKGPALFSEFGKSTRDLLNKDYSTETGWSVSPLQILTSASAVAIKYSLAKKYQLDVLSKPRLKYKNAELDIKLADLYTELIITDVLGLPSTKAKASIQFPDYYNSSKFELQCRQKHASFTAAVVGLDPTVRFSGTIGTPSIALGAQATYNLMTNSPSCNAGVSLRKTDFCATLILANNFDSIKASYLHRLNEDAVVGGEVSGRFSKVEDTVVTVGVSYEVDPWTTVKARVNSRGNIAALLQRELGFNSTFTLSCSLDTNTLMHKREPKFGLALSIKP